MKHVDLLWTGGWDSTFRLCQLSRKEGVEVQPIYFDGEYKRDRTNWKKEMQAQDTILPMIRQKEATKAVILPPIRLEDKDLPKNPAFDKAFEECIKYPHSPEDIVVPGQIRFLGKLPKVYPGLEYCLEGPTVKQRKKGMDSGYTVAFLRKHGFRFKFHADGYTDVDLSRADPNLKLLWSGFTFPVLGLSKLEMLTFIKRWGYQDIFVHTWSCDQGGAEPCGICHNCCIKWDSGLQATFPPSAVRNHEIREYLEKHDIDQATRDFLLIGPTSIVRLFIDYVGHDYQVVNHINILTLPQALQRVVYEKQLERKARLQAFFDDLVTKWDRKKKGGRLEI